MKPVDNAMHFEALWADLLAPAILQIKAAQLNYNRPARNAKECNREKTKKKVRGTAIASSTAGGNGCGSIGTGNRPFNQYQEVR